MSEEETLALIWRAIADPGAATRRGTDHEGAPYGETLPSWCARAVMDRLRAVGLLADRSRLNAEVAGVLDQMAQTAREMGEERIAAYIEGHAGIYRSVVTR